MPTRLALTIAGCLVITACSSSGQQAQPPPSRSTSPSSNAGPTNSASPTSSADQAAIQQYLMQVNGLCDALLPKVLAAVHGGHDGIYPVTTYEKEVPITNKLEAQFDQQLAKIPVPAAATKQHAALMAYINYANQLNAKRKAAAARGQAAFDKEIEAENVEVIDDPNIINRDAAGFNSSCNAR